MDTLRLILITSLVLVTLKLWTDWEIRYGPKTTEEISVLRGDQTDFGHNEIPELRTEHGTNMSPSPVTELSASYTLVNVYTDTFQLKINPRGAGIHYAALIKFPVSVDQQDKAFVLMDDSEHLHYVIQGGLLSKQPAATHEALFQTPYDNYSLAVDKQTLDVPFTWEASGVQVTKTFRFTRGSHLIRVIYEVSNNSDTAWAGRSYTQLKRDNPGRSGRRIIYTYTGAVMSGPENRYEKIDFDEISDQPIERDVQNGWVAMIQHYFLTAVIPEDKSKIYHYYTKALIDNLFIAGVISPMAEILPGEKKEIATQYYIGPKDQEILDSIAEGLDLTVDYGVLWFIAKPLFWCLNKVHKITGNWGWSIILITVLLKVLFYQLSAAGYRSMANMRKVQPRIMSIRDRYKDDKAQLNQAMMQIYKEEKINPLGGCFPIMIQIPVFIALYWVLLESVELRQAGFILWLDDLSTPDPYWVLPILMGLTMFIQQKLNPAPLDPVQAKVMMILPFAFTIFFGFFPSGLVLYWVANNTLSIGQQWLITRSIEQARLGPQSE